MAAEVSVEVRVAGELGGVFADGSRVTYLVTDAAAEVLMELVRDGLLRRVSRRGYWVRAADSVEAGRVSAEEVRIGVPHVGVGLIWKGGEVRPTGRRSEVTGRPIRSLLIPFDDSPLRELDLSLFEYKQRARGSVHPLRTRSGKMILVDEVKGKGKKAKGEMIGLGVLVARAVIREHADVMPGEEELERCAEGAARDVLDAMARGLVM